MSDYGFYTGTKQQIDFTRIARECEVGGGDLVVVTCPQIGNAVVLYRHSVYTPTATIKGTMPDFWMDEEEFHYNSYIDRKRIYGDWMATVCAKEQIGKNIELLKSAKRNFRYEVRVHVVN